MNTYIIETTGSKLTLDNIDAFTKKLNAGNVQADELRQHIENIISSEQEIKKELNGFTIDELKKKLGFSRYTKKADLINDAFRRILHNAIPTGNVISYMPFSEKFSDAIKREASKVTDEDIKKYASERTAKIEKYKNALTNPQTLEDFETFIITRGENKLTPEQKVKYDELVAERDKGKRVAEQEYKATIAKVQDLKDVNMSVVTHFHTKRGHHVSIVQLDKRVSPETFKELQEKARRLGGSYAMSYKCSPAGFQFDALETAQRFMSLKEGNIAGAERVAEKTAIKQSNAVEHLRSVANSLETKANTSLNADRKVNTARQAGMAASAEAKANKQLATAKTMRALADAIESGEAKHLDGVRTATHIETLDSILNHAKYRASKASGESYDRMQARDPQQSDVDHTEYPYPYINTSSLKQAANYIDTVKGIQLAINRLYKLITPKSERDNYFHVEDPKTIEDLRDVASKLKDHPYVDVKSVGERLANGFQHYDRLQAMGLNSDAQLRAALREYINFKNPVAKTDPIKQLERDLIGHSIPGYFPTPKPIVARMLDIADIRRDMRVLEPSAGKGNIADAIRDNFPQVSLDTVEYNNTLRGILAAKGHNVVGSNFLEHQGEYDRIIMNPPFEDGQDIAHVRHAYNLLKDGGKIVAIMSEGTFFNNSQKAKDFRVWLESVGGESQQLPEGSFRNSERSTTVNTRLVLIEKPLTYAQLPYQLLAS